MKCKPTKTKKHSYSPFEMIAKTHIPPPVNIVEGWRLGDVCLDFSIVDHTDALLLKMKAPLYNKTFHTGFVNGS